jgi:hypothetical protein
MRNDNDGAAGSDAPDVLIDDGLAVRIERARGLVEDQDPRVKDQRPGDRKPLSLAAR